MTTFGWHSIFVVPMVAMAILFGLGLRFVKNLETSEAHLDVLSVVLAAVLLTALSLGLVQLTIDAFGAWLSGDFGSSVGGVCRASAALQPSAHRS